MDLQGRLEQDMKAALKGGDKQRLAVIRMVLSDVRVIDLAAQKTTAEQAVAAYAKKLRKSLEEFEKYGKADVAAQLRYEIGVVEEYLPKRADDSQTEALIDAFVAANTFTEKQFGQAMGMFLKQHAGAVEPGVVNPILKRKLAGRV
jgi:uncharacterized protein